jgi:hypothetical protein
MWDSGHLISGLDVATGAFALMVFSAGVAVVILIVLARFMLRRAGQGGMGGALWVCGLLLVGGMFAYVLNERFTLREQAAERRAIEARAAELTNHSLAPGSALGCLDAVASIVVENACERPLFASPEAVAAAVAYVDARFSLLVASTPVAERDPSYQPAFERLRRSLEADRYGLVAHVLMTRGCDGPECAELRLLRDPTRVVANMRGRAFEASLGAHALTWQSNGASTGVASATPSSPPQQQSPLSPPTVPPMATIGAGPGTPVTSGGPGAASPPKFDFPSASSIPPVSIMSAEPGTPDSRSTPPKRSAAPPTRRQSAREPAAAPSPSQLPHAPPPPSPPTQITPEIAPEPPAPPAFPDPHTTR